MTRRELINEVNERTSIVDLVSGYVKLEKKGKNYRGLCPFHDDTNPSFSVSVEKNIAKCFSCGKGGSPLTFYQQINNVTFDEALRKLAEPLGLKVERKDETKTLKEHEALKDALTFYNYYLFNSKSGEEILAYLTKRGLNKEIINEFKIGFSPNEDALYKILKEKGYEDDILNNTGLFTKKGNQYTDFFKERIMFPITDESNNITGFSGRSLTSKAKYVNSVDSFVFNKNKSLYNIFKAMPDIVREKRVIIHEGYFDCIASAKAGIKNTVATMGTALTNDQALMISKITKHVILGYDGDNPGIEATLKAIKVFKGKNVKIDILPLEKLDPDEYLIKHGKAKYLSLFNNLVDEYAFQYNYYKSILNLNNMNEVDLFKEYIKEMLSNASKGVKEIYLNKLSSDLGVSVNSLYNITRTERVIKRETIPSKLELPSKYYNAEEILFLIMLTSIDKAKQIDQTLSSRYVADRTMFKLRTLLIINYYSLYDEFNLDVFIEMLNNEAEKEELINKLSEITSRIEYTANFKYGDDDLYKMLETLKEVNDEKEYNQILSDIKKETESYTKTYLVEKQKALKLKKMKNN